ncbi:MAG: Gfo/Idh/MocA family oxidoreductase [Rhodobacteraceae bacterium]|nr:Gfo/Idh/MocA family oxidoreductase [Paracoccaceae bacterium]
MPGAPLREIGVIVDGATGRLGRNAHLEGSLLAMRAEGGLPLADGTRLVPRPVLLGRDPGRLAAVAGALGGLPFSTDRESLLSDPANGVYFDAALTAGRHGRAMAAIAAGKHVYLEKPAATSHREAQEIARASRARGLKGGVVQDKLWLPGMQKLLALRRAGFFGRILSARLEFGWWVFDGFDRPMPRSDWNYRRDTQGGIVLDMFTHWQYLIDALVGEVRAVCCTMSTRQPRRRTPAGVAFDVDVEDEATALVEVEGGALVRVQASWARRVVDEDILTLAIDGTRGSAIAGVHHCRVQSAADTPLAVWNYRDPAAHAAGLAAAWSPAPEAPAPADSYRAGWEAFLRHLVGEGGFSATLEAGARGLQFVEACHRSAASRCWVDVPALATDCVSGGE